MQTELSKIVQNSEKGKVLLYEKSVSKRFCVGSEYCWAPSPLQIT